MPKLLLRQHRFPVLPEQRAPATRPGAAYLLYCQELMPQARRHRNLALFLHCPHYERLNASEEYGL